MLVLLLMAVMGAWAETIDLATVTTATTANNGDVLTGTLANNVRISIDEGATVTLNNVTINGSNSSSYYWAGITCKGNATIILTGVNFVKGFHQYYPGIHIPKDKTLTIQGSGSLTACSNGNCAGIGAGESEALACGNIVIEGGTIIATGGDNAAGIGGGFSSSCGDIFIRGGNITATGGEEGAGIGAGSSLASCGNISITGGTVNATGGSNAAAIGGGDGSICGTITITDGVSSLTANKVYGAPNSIGAGLNGTCGTVTIGGINKGSISASPYTYLALADNEDNSSTLTLFNNITADVTLRNRKLYKDGEWNTLCLPFNVTISGSPLAGATLKELVAGQSNLAADGKLTLTFTDASSIEAGKPYLIKWDKGSGDDIDSPFFNGVTITSVEPTPVLFANALGSGDCSFVGQYDPFEINSSNKNSIVMLSSGSRIGYSNNVPRTLRCMRAHFEIPTTTSAPAMTDYAIDFDGEASTAMKAIDNGQWVIDHVYYDLAGRRVAQPTKGLYIFNGKKVMIP